MKKKIFRSKTIFYLNLIVNIFYLFLTILSLVLIQNDYKKVITYDVNLTVYYIYLIIYILPIIILYWTPKRAIDFLTLLYLLGIVLNVSELNELPFKYDALQLVVVIFFTAIHLILIFVNYKFKYVSVYGELEEIGQKDN